MKKILFLLFLIPSLVLGQCAGVQSATLNPLPINGNYEPGTVVTMCYTMNGWDTGFGANWIEGFGINLGPGWVSYTPVSGPDDCSGATLPQQWLWMESVTNNAGTLTVGPGYFYEGPTGPIDGNPGNDWGDFGTNCLWTFCIQLQVTDECDPLSLLIEVTPYGDGTMGSWGNEACFDGPFQAFNGTVIGGDVTTSPISITTDTTCYYQTLDYSVTNTPGSTYNWQLSGGGVLSSTGNTAQVYWGNTPGSYTISVQETTVDGCVGPVVDTAIVVVEPVVTLGMPYTICPNTPINLFSIPADGVWSGFNIEANTFNTDTPGDYYATYTANIYGCLVTDSVLITVLQPPVAEWIVNSGTYLDFCRQSQMQSYLMSDLPGVVYTWYVDGELQNDDDFELQMIWPDSSMDHFIEVYGTDSIGCKGEKSYLTVNTTACHRLYVPNSFTPNGDGYNDAFIVRGLSVYQPILQIYNRWGQLVHHSYNLSPWNGNDGNGYYCETGVYAWTLHYVDDKGFNHMEQGHVVLVR
jgi:gliding motility-associated-like protein